MRPVPLTRERFARFGDVIETAHAQHYAINAGWAERFHDLAALEVDAAPGRPGLSIFRAAPRPRPVPLTLMERHRLSSQAFMPLGSEPFLVVVADPARAPSGAQDLVAFITDGRQGVNYRPGVWHHPLLALEKTSDFIVIDRIADEQDCDEVRIDEWRVQVVWD